MTARDPRRRAGVAPATAIPARRVATRRPLPTEAAIEEILARLRSHPDLSVTVVPMGDVGQALPALHPLEKRLPLRFGAPLPLPHHAFDPKKNQYRAADFIAYVRDRTSSRALGVTHVDIYDPPKNFVFGLAETQGSAAVISTFRLQHPARKIFWQRVRKEAVHEIGHLVGLHHCHSPKCVMFFSTDIGNTDAKGEWFCARCSSVLGAMYEPPASALS